MANNEPITITSATIAGYELIDARMSIKISPKAGVDITPDELCELEKTQFEYIRKVLDENYAGIPLETKLSSVDIPHKYHIEKEVIHCAKTDMSLDASRRQLACEYSQAIEEVLHDNFLREMIQDGTFFYVPERGKFQVRLGSTFEDIPANYSRREIYNHPLKKYLLSQKGNPINQDNTESSFPNKQSLKRLQKK